MTDSKDDPEITDDLTAGRAAQGSPLTKRELIGAYSFGMGQGDDPGRIPKLLDNLERVWLLMPDLRLGQLIVILTRFDAEDRDSVDVARVFAIKDESIEKVLNSFPIR